MSVRDPTMRSRQAVHARANERPRIRLDVPADAVSRSQLDRGVAPSWWTSAPFLADHGPPDGPSLDTPSKHRRRGARKS
jgi:hypothetical protein